MKFTEKIKSWLEKNNFIEGELTAESAKYLTSFGFTGVREAIFKKVCQDIDESIKYKSTHNSLCLAVEVNDGIAMFLKEIKKEYERRGFKVTMISKETIGTEVDIIFIKW